MDICGELRLWQAGPVTSEHLEQRSSRYVQGPAFRRYRGSKARISKRFVIILEDAIDFFVKSELASGNVHS